MSVAPLIGLVLGLTITSAALSGCLQTAIDQNAYQLRQQQAQLDRLKQQIETLQAQQARAAYNRMSASAGGCDSTVVEVATRRGGDRFAAGDFPRALAYYQDALAACPGNPRAELNLARAYEALGRRSTAIIHYRRAAADTTDDGARSDAHAALLRLGVKH